MIAGRYLFSAKTGSEESGALRFGVDQRTGRRVVFEQVGPTGFDSDHRERAEREARSAAGFVHPNAARVLDLVVDDQTGVLWLVAEPVNGLTLTDVVRRKGAHDMQFTLDVTRQVVDALAAAHARGVVHRSVSPANITIDRHGQAKVTGFGVARMPVTGSAAYLAPEVVGGQTGNKASDAWSLGATLFFALTGRPPYDIRLDLVDGLDRIIEDPPPRLANSGPLGALLEVTMTKDPWRRWSMAAVRDHLSGPSSMFVDPTVPRQAARRPAPPTRSGLTMR